MGRGDAKRKREARALRAQAEKRRIDPVLLLEKGKKPKKRREGNEDMPASLRKMLKLKAVAEGKPAPSIAQRRPQTAPNHQVKNATHPAEEKNTEEQPGEQLEEVERPEKKRKQAEPKPTLEPAKPTLKSRKKEFLKKKKLRKKGKYIPHSDDEDEEESDPEMRLKKATAASRPAFNEQAAAPIQVNLKRKHWTDNEKRAADRCKAIYQKQLDSAKKQLGAGSAAEKAKTAAARVGVIEAYRKKKNRGSGGSGATLQSLAMLVKRDPVTEMLYKYNRGDVVLFNSPTHPKELLIKRVIGLEGDWVSIPGSSKIEKIPKGHAWLEGDNASMSEDSRTAFGPVPLACFKSRVVYVVWPPSRWGPVERNHPKGRVLAMSSPGDSSLGPGGRESWWSRVFDSN